MNFLSTNDLRPGLIFSEPVYTEGTNILVPANFPLRQKDIDLLVSWGLDVVRTEGYIIETENNGQDDGQFYAKKGEAKFSITDVEQNSGPYRDYIDLIEKLNVVFTDFKA